MTDQRRVSDDGRSTTFAMGRLVAAVVVALAACTAPNPNYRAPLQSLAVSPGSLVPAFAPATMTYSVDVASSVASVAVTAVPKDDNAIMTVSGQETTLGQERKVSLNAPGVSTEIPIVVTTAGGSQNTYVVTVNRMASGENNQLLSMTVSPGSLAPVFDPSTTAYAVAVGNATASVAITATLQETNATMTVNGQATSSGQERTISLNGPGVGTQIPIVVTAANGSQNTYIVTVNRAALSANNNLQSLSVVPGSMSPPFVPDALSYTVNVPATVSAVAVTAVVQDSNAIMTVDNQVTISNQSRSIALNGPGTTTITNIIVTAENGNQKMYVVSTTRLTF